MGAPGEEVPIWVFDEGFVGALLRGSRISGAAGTCVGEDWGASLDAPVTCVIIALAGRNASTLGAGRESNLS